MSVSSKSTGTENFSELSFLPCAMELVWKMSNGDKRYHDLLQRPDNNSDRSRPATFSSYGIALTFIDMVKCAVWFWFDEK